MSKAKATPMVWADVPAKERHRVVAHLRDRARGAAIYVVSPFGSAHTLRLAIEALRSRKPNPNGCPVYREACFDHGFVHGAEAEELREGIEKVLATHNYPDDAHSLRCELQAILDRVDARDSLAYREATDRKRRKTRMAK